MSKVVLISPVLIIIQMFCDIIMTADRENKARMFSIRLLTRIGANRWMSWRGTYNNDY